MSNSKSQTLAAIFIVFSAVLYFLVFIFSGFQSPIPLIGFILFFACAFVVYKNWRMLSYLVFLILLISMIIAFATANFASLMGIFSSLIALSDLIALLFLFVYLWRDKPRA